MQQQRRGGLVGGLILIGLGVLFLVQQWWPDVIGDWVFVVGLGVILLAGYIVSRQYGFLIPGCILTGIGVGLAVVETNLVTGPDVEGGTIVLGLGLGFVAIWLIDLLVSRGRPGGWWPLIPGGILSLVGIGILAESQAWLETIADWWPLIFIVIGVLIILQVLRRPS